MTAVKGLALGIVVITGVALEARGEPVRRGSWRWTSWVAGRGVFQASLSEASAFVPPPAPVVPPPAPVVPPPAPVVPPPPAPVVPPPAPVVPVLAPDHWQSLGRFAMTSPIATALPADPALSPIVADAFLDFGVGPFSQADLLTAGGAQAWYTSRVVTGLYGGIPNAQQRAEFTAAVLRGVERVYHQNGLPLTLTDDPHVRAAHTLSIVAQTSSPSHPDAIGIAIQGGDGFTFIDRFGGAGSIADLTNAVIVNASHELMHQFGVGHHDLTGQFIDAEALTFAVLSDPETDFSAAAVADLASRDFRRTANLIGGVQAGAIDGQALAPQPVPEPATLGLWAAALTGLAWTRRRRPGLESAPRA